ncbi:DsbA family protein [Mesorhizobium xinjiangense]|uniref:DsbA family protein n=1 Tax=Mesorhizobium xinjiangense TaxID=2678685 RepID=UPI0012EE927A|nr:DsbA family protein [Mesorhizobium xinjiangense]
MLRLISRRNFIASVAALPASAGLLAACSESEAEGTSANTVAQAETTASTSAAPEPLATVDAAKLMEPGPLPEMALGDENAPVTIVEYASMTCSHCAHFHRTTFPELKSKYIDTGKARLVMREFPFDPRAEAGFMLARCADDKYFAMTDVLFKQQESWAPVQDARSALLQIAKLAGFSQESFEACLTNQELLDDVRAVRNRGAEDFGVEATPTFFINGNKYAGAMSIDEMSAIIDSML